MIRRSTVLMILPMALVFAILIALGTWQVQRLHWKEALIARVDARLESPPADIETAYKNAGDDSAEYSPVNISGHFVNSGAVFEFTTFDGQSGWHVFSPFKLTGAKSDGEDIVLINRGFIPYDMRDKDDFGIENTVDGITMTGLLRLPLAQKPGRFVNDNDPATKTFFWRDIPAMAKELGVNPDNLLPWYLDAGLPGQQLQDRNFPIPGTTLVQFSNSHLQYAVTWYGLALSLLGVGSYFLYSRGKDKA